MEDIPVIYGPCTKSEVLPSATNRPTPFSPFPSHDIQSEGSAGESAVTERLDSPLNETRAIGTLVGHYNNVTGIAAAYKVQTDTLSQERKNAVVPVVRSCNNVTGIAAASNVQADTLSQERKNTVVPVVRSCRFNILIQPMAFEAKAFRMVTEMEIFFHRHIRRKSFPRGLFMFALFLACVLATTESMLVTQTRTFDEASLVCQERSGIVFSQLPDNDEQQLMEHSAHRKLIPRQYKHIINVCLGN
jgi:hypothetical protein